MMGKVSQLPATGTNLYDFQGFSKGVYMKLTKAKTHERVLITLGSFAAVLWVDTCSYQLIHRSLDKMKVYWINKKVDLGKMDKENQNKALDEALDSCSFPEHLRSFFKPPPSPLDRTEKEELEELYEHFQQSLDGKGWREEEVFYEKYFENLDETVKSSFPYSMESGLRFWVALLCNYWSLLIAKTPQLVKLMATQTRNTLKDPFLHPFKTSISIYACQNLFTVLHEILTKLELIDKNSSWGKKIEKLSKNLSSESELFFLKKDRKISYAMIHLLIPLVLIYVFRAPGDSLDIKGRHRLDKIKRQPFSFQGAKHNLQCLDNKSKKALEEFFQSSSSIARLSGSFKELLMGMIQDFEHFKELEALIEKTSSSRFFYLTNRCSSDSKKAYLRKLKDEIAITDRKQQVVLVLDQDSWNDLKDEDFLKDFLQGITDRKWKILLVGDEKEAVFDKLEEIVPTGNSGEVKDVVLKPSIGELLRKYFEDHPLASIETKYRAEKILEDLFLGIWSKENEQEKSKDRVKKVLERMHENFKEYEKKAIKKLGYKGLKKIQLYNQRINSIKKYRSQEILKRLKVEDFSKLEETEKQLRYRKIKNEIKALEIITKRLKSKRSTLA